MKRSKIIALGLLAGLALTAAGKLNQTPEADWPLYGLTAYDQHYSPLQQIDKQSVSRLGVAWQFTDFVQRGRVHYGNEATPLMVDGILYFAGPWNVVYALDAVTGKELWRFDPEIPGQVGRDACCGIFTRGVAYKDGKIFDATIDGNLIAIDAKTGKQLWKTDTVTDHTRSITITGAPRVAGDNIIIGNSGAEMGVRGYVSAINAETGKLAWRFWIIPGAGPDETPDVTEARKTWDPTTRWELGGGGTAWDNFAYDPETDTVFIGAGNGGPWPAWLRNTKGLRQDNLFLSSIIAVNNKDGRKRWHYQTTPGDSWDFTATMQMMLADINIGGKARKVLMQAPKNGFFYVLDRQSGELLKADKYTAVTWADGVDMKTGRPIISEKTSPIYKDSPKIVWPGPSGGHNWPAMAYSPQTGLVYIPINESPTQFVSLQAAYQRGSGAVVGVNILPTTDSLKMTGEPDRHVGVLKAWDPTTGKTVWQTEELPFFPGGVLATASGLIFSGTLDGGFTVRDAANGKAMKRLDFGVAIMAPPITYSINGVQYIAVLAGSAGSPNQIPYNPGHAALKYQNIERLIVMKLDGGPATLPPPALPIAPQPIYTEGLSTDPAVIQKGGRLYGMYCGRCHMPSGAQNAYPSLWNLSPEAHEAFEAIVLGGAFEHAGMPNFSEMLKADEVKAIHSFLSADAARLRAGGKAATARPATN